MTEDPTIPESETPATELPIVHIPECCREGWESCPHVVNRPTVPAKRNIAV